MQNRTLKVASIILHYLDLHFLPNLEIWHAELLPKLLGFNTSSAGLALLEMLRC